jgi:hypothetical protein
MKRTHAPTLIGIVGITAGGTILFGFPVGKVEPAMPTIKVPGAYPYEETVQLPAATPVPESSPLPSSAPFPYPDSRAPASVRDSQTANARRPLTAESRARGSIQIQWSGQILWIFGGAPCGC